MNGEPRRATTAPRWIASASLLAMLLVASIFFALLTDLAWPLSVAVAAASVLTGGFVRTRRATRGVAPLPVLIGLLILATNAPSTTPAELFGGVVPVALLAWVADDPSRAPGGLARAAPTLLFVLLMLAIAWACAFLLPPGESLIGFGSGLLVAALLLVAVLLGRPDLIDREPAATA